VPVAFSFLGIQASNWTIKVDMDFASYIRSESPTRFTEDAVTSAIKQQSFTMANGYVAPTSRRLTTQPQQSVRYWKVDFFYQAKDSVKGVFTKEALMEIRDFEQRIINFPLYDERCSRYADGGRCRPPDSVLNIFFANVSLNNQSNEVNSIYDGTGELVKDIDGMLLNMAKEAVFWWTDKDFTAVNRISQYTRSSFRGGLPARGYPKWNTGFKAQADLHKAWLVKLFNELLDDVNEGENAYKHITISWYEQFWMREYETLSILTHDATWSVGSFIFVIAILGIQLKSLVVTMFGMLGVMLSFTTSYYFYYVVLDYKEMSILNFISVFLIIGIAADDVLVLKSTYTFAAAKFAKDASARQRMRWAYREAASAMLVTTVTTCGSFFSLCLSSVPVVRSFAARRSMSSEAKPLS
jgi:hypothetical protein